MGCRRPPREGFCRATDRMRNRIASRENVTESLSHSLTQPALSASLLSFEPSSSFSLFNVNYLMLWALWSCGRRAGVVQAQRQIHRAFCWPATPPLTSSHASCSLPVDENRPGAIKPGFGCRSAELLVAGAGVACSV